MFFYLNKTITNDKFSQKKERKYKCRSNFKFLRLNNFNIMDFNVLSEDQIVVREATFTCKEVVQNEKKNVV